MEKNKIILLWFLSLFSFTLFGQNESSSIAGEISFISSNNIYVKFENTSNINIGDTLQIINNEVFENCMVVTQKSSTSCVCLNITDNKFQVGNKILHTFKSYSTIPKENNIAIQLKPEIITPIDTTVKSEEKVVYEERIRGRISAAGNSTLSSSNGDRHRMKYRLSLNAFHIRNSKFSFQTYLSYRQNFIPKNVAYNKKTKFFGVYNLALIYDFNSSTSITFGRKINNKISSLGAIDGLQIEKNIGNNYMGIIVGFRPDIYNYKLNTNLFEYGGYIGRGVQTTNIYAKTTLGFLEQKNNGETDRRYTYFQHSSTLMKKLTLFTSFELDLYRKINGMVSTDPKLTNLFTSIRYRPYRWLNLSVSYNTRKRILYYVTYLPVIVNLSDDEAHQGIRTRLSIKPIKYLTIGASYGKRFQNNQANKSNVLNGYLSYSKLPYVGGRLALRYNINSSNYREGNILSIRYGRTIIRRKLNGDFYYRNVKNTYISSGIIYNLNYYGASFSLRITKKLSLSIMGELSTPYSGNTYRFNTKIIKRFDTRKK